MHDILEREPKAEPNPSHREGPIARTITRCDVLPNTIVPAI